MHFKKLELFGFKSFAEKTQLHFEPGVTAIVGPNGCGKSNISDSIRWVLGENSPKSLRGAKMEDVIFNGTDKMDPVGLAEVSLTLSNHQRILPVEFEEVTVTRRVFRSGESEYFLNNTQVRLRDILELFMGTGLGADRYAFIEQGHIDAVVGQNAEERRALFEEAAGVSRYKSKKREALRKLEATENNLLRVEDILREAKRQLDSIQRQAVKAKRYRELFEELKSIEVALAGAELAALSGRVASIDAERQSLRATLGEESQAASSKTSEWERVRGLWMEFEERRQERQQQGVAVDAAEDRCRTRMALHQDRLRELEARRSDLIAQIERLSSASVEQSERVEQQRKSTAELVAAEGSKRSLLSEKTKRQADLEASIREAETWTKRAKVERIELAAAVTNLKNETAKLAAEIGGLGRRRERLGLEKAKTSEEMAQAVEAASALEADLRQAKERFETIEAELAALKIERDRLREALEACAAKAQGVHEEEKVVESKVKLYREWASSHEGFSSGVKALLAERQTLPAEIQNEIVGLLADLLETEPGYEAAIEAALGEDVQALVVRTRQGAADLAARARERQWGRVRFLVVENGLACDGAGESGTREFSRWVRAPQEMEALLAGRLRGVEMADNLSAALQALSQRPGGVWVTRDGERLEAHLVLGGSSGPDSFGLLNRQGKIREFERRLEELAGLKAELASETEQLAQQGAQAEEAFARMEARRKTEEASLRDVERRSELAEGSRKRFQEELSLLDLELDEVTVESNDLSERQGRVRSDLEAALVRERELEQGVSEREEGVRQHSVEREALLVEATVLESELASLEQNAAAQRQALEAQEEALRATAEALERSIRERDESARREEELSHELEDLKRFLEVLESHREALGEETRVVAEKARAIARLVEALEQLRSEAEARRSALLEKVQALELEQTRLDYEARALKERIFQSYEVDFASQNGDVPAIQNPEESRSRAEQLKSKIKSLGTVNLVALEEETSLVERHAFLTAQRDDLTQGREQLLQAIQKINRTSREMFWETFQKVQVHFQDYYRMLFGGGKAELVLLDEKDVLESGIDIRVQPPGKKLQYITLLSGGEKAMTAIALLFALFKVRPSPFCVLDEIDAPLDEANVDRFTRVLREFLKDSQFIIITHNKKTISMADVMYGVTMEQTGVSKIVSVKFQKREEERQTA